MAAFPTTQKIASPTTLITANGGFKASVGIILSSYADLTAANANTYLKDYAGALIATSADILYYRNQAANNWIQILTTVPINTLLAATGTNTINNAALQQEWQWNSLSNGVGLFLSSTATQATSFPTLFAVRVSGDNTNSNQTTLGASFVNVKTGAFNTNIAAQFTASAGSNNYAIIVDAGRTGLNTTTPTEVLDVAGNVRFSGALMPNNLAGTTGQVLTSAGTGTVPTWNTLNTEGTYTPTLTNIANIDSSTASITYYQRIGNSVYVWGDVIIDPTSAGTITEMGMSIPVASNFSNTYELSGTGAFLINTAVQIYADTGNDRATFRFTAQVNNGNTYSFHFSYKIL